MRSDRGCGDCSTKVAAGSSSKERHYARPQRNRAITKFDWLCRPARVSLARCCWRLRAVGVLVRSEERPEGGSLAHLTIDNAGKLNSLNRTLMIEIIDTAAGLGDDPRLRAAVLTGAGERAFVGGADVAEIAALDHAT